MILKLFLIKYFAFFLSSRPIATQLEENASDSWDHHTNDRRRPFLALLSKNWTVCRRHWTFLVFFAILPLVGFHLLICHYLYLFVIKNLLAMIVMQFYSIRNLTFFNFIMILNILEKNCDRWHLSWPCNALGHLPRA